MAGLMNKRIAGTRDRPLELRDLDPLWQVTRQLQIDQNRLNKMVIEHMEEEEKDRKAVLEVFKGFAESVKDILKAIPEDVHGRPDFHGHREDHVEQREHREIRKEDRKTIARVFYETATHVAIGLAVLVFLGDHAVTYFHLLNH